METRTKQILMPARPPTFPVIAMCRGTSAMIARGGRAGIGSGFGSGFHWSAFSAVCSVVHDVFAAAFPTLLRTTGAGFCYNIGRIAAAFGTVIFGLFAPVGDFRHALLYAGFLFPVAMTLALLLPEPPDTIATRPNAPANSPLKKLGISPLQQKGPAPRREVRAGLALGAAPAVGL